MRCFVNVFPHIVWQKIFVGGFYVLKIFGGEAHEQESHKNVFTLR